MYNILNLYTIILTLAGPSSQRQRSLDFTVFIVFRHSPPQRKSPSLQSSLLQQYCRYSRESFKTVFVFIASDANGTRAPRLLALEHIIFTRGRKAINSRSQTEIVLSKITRLRLGLWLSCLLYRRDSCNHWLNYNWFLRSNSRGFWAYKQQFEL